MLRRRLNGVATVRRRQRHLRWIVPTAILALAAFLRVWALARPGTLVFDELYYVRDAVSQLAHGYPTTWPDDDPAFGAERAQLFSDEASSIAHPPLGKWLIGLGILLFGADSGWGWRIAVALFGTATVGLAMRLGFVLSRNHLVAWIAGLLLAVDGVHVVLSRVSLLDGFLTFFVALGALCLVHDWRWCRRRAAPDRALWCRPWLLAAGLVFGAATAVKWSGLYALAAFLLLLTLADLLRRWGEDRRPMLQSIRQGVVTAMIALPAAAAAYLVSWAGWIAEPGAQDREPGVPWWVSLWRWHLDAFTWHSTLDAPHPFQSNPLTWPLGLRPTAMYDERWDGYVAAITPIPNPLVTWGGVVALVFLLSVVTRAILVAMRTRRLAPLRARTTAVAAFVLVGYLSGWLPWVLTVSRSAVFQFYAVVLTPFAAIALALLLASFASPVRGEGLMRRAGISLAGDASALQGRRIAVTIFLTATLVLGLLFWPLWIGMPVDHWFYRLHLWLPGWV